MTTRPGTTRLRPTSARPGRTRWEVVLASGFVAESPAGSTLDRSDSDAAPGIPAHWVARRR